MQIIELFSVVFRGTRERNIFSRVTTFQPGELDENSSSACAPFTFIVSMKDKKEEKNQDSYY